MAPELIPCHRPFPGVVRRWILRLCSPPREALRIWFSAVPLGYRAKKVPPPPNVQNPKLSPKAWPEGRGGHVSRKQPHRFLRPRRFPHTAGPGTSTRPGGGNEISPSGDTKRSGCPGRVPPPDRELLTRKMRLLPCLAGLNLLPWAPLFSRWTSRGAAFFLAPVRCSFLAATKPRSRRQGPI